MPRRIWQRITSLFSFPAVPENKTERFFPWCMSEEDLEEEKKRLIKR